MQEPQETLFQSLGQEDPLEEGLVTHSSILAWKIPWTEESGELQTMGSLFVDTTKEIEHTNQLKNRAHVLCPCAICHFPKRSYFP